MTQRLLISLLAIGVAAACSPAARVDVDAERDAILAADRAWAESGGEDAAAFASAFVSDGVFVPSGGASVWGGLSADEFGSLQQQSAGNVGSRTAGGSLDSRTDQPVEQQDGPNFRSAVEELVDRGLIPAEIANDRSLLIDKTNMVGLRRADVFEGDLKSTDIREVGSLSKAQTLAESGEWRIIKGVHESGAMTIYKHATMPGGSRWLSRSASVGFSPPVPLTGRQNLVETIHHEYLHFIDVPHHVQFPGPWGTRVRKDLEGWISGY